MVAPDFYRAFEEKYRGDRSTIKKWLEVYTPFLDLLKSIELHPKALDLGCGRGEWLELLNENGFQAKGVDTDAGMLQACHTLGLNAMQQDCFEALHATPSQTQTVITGFHLAEHLSLEQLNKLFELALKALVPGGLLILETPNPENIRVGTAKFYLDPTHTRPLPELLLHFLAEYHGFERTTTLYLHEAAPLTQETSVSLFHVIAGGAQDYAMIAQKKAPLECMQPFDRLFEKPHGTTTDQLAQRFEARLRELENQCLQANTNIESLNHLYQSMLGSLSWKITKPLRWVKQILK